MSARKSNDPAWIGVLCRVYTAALWLYPRSHREQWGAEMRLAFRDRCREAGRDGRGPLSVLFAELLPDLASTVGLEHVDALYSETNPMKRLLMVLVLAFVAVVMLHAQVTPALDAVHGWWRQRENVAIDRAYTAHLQALADTTEQQRHDADDDVTAAILYWNAPSDSGNWRPTYWNVDHGGGNGAVAGATDPAANKALRDKADAAFARALKADDRLALWLAVRACPARPAVCAPDVSLARLHQVDPDNGAVWLLELDVALRGKDPTRARSALARLAQSTRFDDHGGEVMRGLLLAFDKLPVPSRLTVDNAWIQATPTESAPLLASALAYDRTENVAMNLKPIADYCRSKEAQVRAERQADCLAAGKLMAGGASSWNNAWAGYHTWLRNAADGERERARVALREAMWLAGGARSQMAPLNSEAAINAWKAAWLAGGNDIDVNRRLMREQGIALNAPASFQLRPEQYDPATY